MTTKFSVTSYNTGIDPNTVIGVTVWRNIHDGRYVTENLYAALEKFGFNKLNLVPETEKTNFLNAARDVAAENHALARKVKDDADHVVLAIIGESVESTEERVNFEHHTKVSYRKVDGTVEGTGPLADAVIVKYNTYRATVDDNRVRNMVTNILRGESGGVNLNPSGGVYFVPNTRLGVVESLANMTDELHLGTIYTLRVPNLPSEKAATMSSVKADIIGRLDGIQDRVGRLNSRLSSITKKQEEANAVQELFDMYVDLLDGEAEVEEIKSRYETLNSCITAKMREVEDRKNGDHTPSTEENSTVGETEGVVTE